MVNSTPWKIVTTENLILKLCTGGRRRRVTRRANFGFNHYSGASTQIAKCYHHHHHPIWLSFLTFSFSILRPGRTTEPISPSMAQTTCFRARMVLLWVRTMGDHIWGNMPQNSAKICVNRQFQAKTAKYKNHNISEIVNRIKTKFEDQAETGNCTWCVV